jgi:hypothetical protein
LFAIFRGFALLFDLLFGRPRPFADSFGITGPMLSVEILKQLPIENYFSFNVFTSV